MKVLSLLIAVWSLTGTSAFADFGKMKLPDFRAIAEQLKQKAPLVVSGQAAQDLFDAFGSRKVSNIQCALTIHWDALPEEQGGEEEDAEASSGSEAVEQIFCEGLSEGDDESGIFFHHSTQIFSALSEAGITKVQEGDVTKLSVSSVKCEATAKTLACAVIR